MRTIYLDADHRGDERRHNLYAGDIYIYSPTEAGRELCQLAASMCCEYLRTDNPVRVHEELAVEDYVEVLKRLKPDFIHHPRCKEIIPKLLKELGCDQDQTFFDVPRLRTACPTDYLSSGMAYAFKPHRDTWYSTPMCQVNWWLPVYPISAGNCMAFHPQYWTRPIRNSSAGFNYQDWNDVGRKQAHNQGKRDTRVQSAALEPVEMDPQIRLVCQPGSVIAFSAAHLHSTVPNGTRDTRISIDFRTVHSADLTGGARNLDGESTGTTANDYLRCRDLEHLSNDQIEACRNWKPQPEFPNHFQQEA